MEKTNVMRILSQNGIKYAPHEYDSSITDGQSIAKMLGEDPMQVFKTLVTQSAPSTYHVFVIPVCCTLNLKKAATAAKVKSIQMIKQKELLPLTGYIHGGCSPIGMKKPFATYVEESAMLHSTIIFSAGRVGYQVEVDPNHLLSFIGASYADLV